MVSILKISVLTIIYLTASLHGVVTAQSTTCPPEGFDALNNLDFAGYIEARWYSIKQIVVPYQPESQFYCVYAEYTPLEKKSWYCRIRGCEDPPSIQVFNSARRNSVTGRVNSIKFQAVVTDAEADPAKALVSPNIIPRSLRKGSNYWVVAAGKFTDLPSQILVPESSDTYDYAIITTALPDSVGKNGCYSSGGMWIFSRVPILPTGAIDDIEEIAKGLGLATEEWLPVEQDGCEY